MAKRSKRNKATGRKAAEVALEAEASWWKSDWASGLILMVLVIVTYQPVWYAGFIWDDEVHVTENPCVIGSLGLKEIWTASAWKFFPLVITTFRLEHQLWGLAPLPYHLVNVFQEAVSTVLLWRVLRSLQVPGAWLGAALWALHPLQVESVAWVAEMKNTESGLFYLLTILFFLRWIKKYDGPGGYDWNYALTMICALLAMASKSTTIVLPAVLVLCAWWVEGRWHWRNLRLVGPIFLLALVWCVINLGLRPSGESQVGDLQWARSWPQRVATSGDVIWFYLGKLLWPYPLMAIYPRWKIDASQWLSYLPLALGMTGFFILWLNRKGWLRPWFFTAAYFLVVLSPFLGLIEQSFWRLSFVEDHLQYLASMGPLALAGAGLFRLSQIAFPSEKRFQGALGAGVLLILGFLSWQRAWVYESQESLWTDTLAKNPECWTGYDNLGKISLNNGQLDKATALFQKALKSYPSDPNAQNNLGNILFQKGQTDEAIAQYRSVLKADPDFAPAHYNLADALLKKGDWDEAIVEDQKSLAITPTYAPAECSMGYAYLQKGQMDEAIGLFQKALAIDPDLAEAHNDLGIAFAHKGRITEAIAEFQAAVRLRPDWAGAQTNLTQTEAMSR